MTDNAKAIIAAAAIIGIALYAGQPRYEIVPAGGQSSGAYVLDKTSGTVTFCALNNCYATK